MQTYSKLLKQGQKISKLKLGNKTINLAYLGNINIKTAYLGSQLVIGNTEKYYRINVDLRNIDYNLAKYREMRMYHENTEAIPFYVRDRFEIVNGTVYLYTYGLGSHNYILDAVSYDYIDPSGLTDINISKNLYGYNYNCYYNKHGIGLYYTDQGRDQLCCYGGNAIGFTISCSKQTYMDDGTTLTYQELTMDSQKIRLSYTYLIYPYGEYSITKMSDLNQSFVKFSYEYNSEYHDYMDMKFNEEIIPSNVSSKLLSYVLEVDVDREFGELAPPGESSFIQNTFDIIWEIDNATFTLPIYHIHEVYKPTGGDTPTNPPIQYYVAVNYVFKDLPIPFPFTEFYVHLYYNGEQINNSNELLQCDAIFGEWGACQIINNISKNLYDKLHSGSATDVFTATFEDSHHRQIEGIISQNEMIGGDYIIALTNVLIRND